MVDRKKGMSKFSLMMIVLSIIAVLLGVGVFYWLEKIDSSSNLGNPPSMSSGKYKSVPIQ